MKAGWKKVPGVGDNIEARWGHTSSTINSNIIYFAGIGSKAFNDCYSYDTSMLFPLWAWLACYCLYCCDFVVSTILTFCS